jgi:proline iminopeptidase
MPKFRKKIVQHDKFYVTYFTKQSDYPNFLFIHGGPGLNSGTFEYLIEHHRYFESINCNLVLYDQRACGRSRNFFKYTDRVTHQDNMNDLHGIFLHLLSVGIIIRGFIGHSYGAKLLFDFYNVTKLNIPGIFISTADSILTPRLNNLMSDLNYLKKTNFEKYLSIIANLNDEDLDNLWKITEELAPYFQQNKDRHLLYWANLEIFNEIQEIQKKINLPINKDVFMSVRKDLYSSKVNFSVDIDSLNIPKLWINGFQDSTIGEPTYGFANKSKVKLFLKSSHYPHLEENLLFCKLVNVFIKTI